MARSRKSRGLHGAMISVARMGIAGSPNDRGRSARGRLGTSPPSRQAP